VLESNPYGLYVVIDVEVKATVEIFEFDEFKATAETAVAALTMSYTLKLEKSTAVGETLILTGKLQGIMTVLIFVPIPTQPKSAVVFALLR
jgi:hypothetical protein